MKSLFDKVNAKLNAQGGFLKAVSILVSGTIFAQLINFITLPLLTRIYSPSDFSIFAVFLSVVSILSTISCLRFEIAISTPKKDGEAFKLLLLALIINFIFSLVLFILLTFKELININIFNLDSYKFLWLIPLAIFFSGTYTSLQYWLSRKKKYKIIAKTKIKQAFNGSLLQIILGLLNFSIMGLIIGQIVKISSGFVIFYKEIVGDLKLYLNDISIGSLKEIFVKYNRYPKYSTFESLANTAGNQLPIILIAIYSIGPEAGYLMLAMQIMAIPLRLIGASVAQVYLVEASKHYQNNNLKQFTVTCIKKLIFMGALPLIIICCLAPILIPMIFGRQWDRTGEMILWMFPLYFTQFITSPISMALHVTNNQKLALCFQSVGVLLRCSGIFLIVNWNSNYLFNYYAISGFLFYCIYMVLIFYAIKK